MARSDDTTRRVALVGGDVREIVRARVVVVADGLLHPSLSTLPALGREVRKASRIGVGAVLFAPGSADTGTVRMAIARSGYVGMVGVGHGRLNVAAALDTRAVRAHGPGATIAGILEACGHRPDSSIDDARWHGTPALSRRLIRPAGRRLLVLGDASGYSEPFTGEGMAWALSDALAAGRLLSRGLADWDPRIESEWLGHLRTRGRRGWTSGAVARILRSPVATRAAVTLAAGVPALARGTIRAFQSPYRPLPKASA
jgi:flavin-dependent dehydrogenase